MSAIVAVLHLDGRPVASEVVRRLTEAMSLNGPDGLAVWVDRAIGMGCASFHTVPEQLDEPMPLANGALALVLDGRIDNRAELRRDCAGRGIVVPDDAGDGAHVLAAYTAWGIEAPAHLVGEWAFVLWDAAEQRLLAARDHMAVRSLRWWCNGRTLLVSSQFPGILEHPDVRAEPNEGMVAEWLAGRPSTIDETLWAGVRNVPGGRRLLCARRGSPRMERYWHPAREAQGPIRSVAEAADAMRDAVTEAVRARLRCIGTPEIELSGGWDSSTVALVASELHAAGGAQDFQLSSTVFPDDPVCDETPYIEAMERHLGRSSLKRPHCLEPFDELASRLGETRHPWRRDDARLLRTSSTHRVTLTGDGGNETLSGTWPSGPATLADALLLRRPQRASARGLWTDVVRPQVRPSLPRRVRIARSGSMRPWLDDDLIRRTSLVERFVDAEPTDRCTTLRRLGMLDWLDGWGTQQNDLFADLDRGRYVELRHPLLDVRLFRLALRLPARVMGSPRTDLRFLHRHAYGTSLPSLVTARTWGTEFTSLRLRELQRLGEAIGEPHRIEAAGWVDARQSSSMVRRALTGNREHWAANLLYAVEAWMLTEARQ